MAADSRTGSAAAPRRREAPGRVLAFAGALALVAGTLVALVSVFLEPRQERNARQAREAALLERLEAQPGLHEALEGFGAEALRTDVVDLSRGCLDGDVDPQRFESPFLTLPGAGRPLADDEDPAGLGVRPSHAVVYRLFGAEDLALLVLPVRGAGYQSMLEGFLVLEADLDTVAGLVFYEQQETPGIGARIAAPDWPEQWVGKRLRDEAGRIRIGVRARGSEADTARYQIDAMTGATFTASGITRLLRFWVGPQGYGPLLARLGAKGGRASARCGRA